MGHERGRAPATTSAEREPASRARKTAARDGRHTAPGPGAEGVVLGLQRQAGNAAVSAVLQRARGAGGSPPAGGAAGAPDAPSVQRAGEHVPDSAEAARRVLGPLAADVRIHRPGGAGPPVPSGALAATEGLDITLGPDAPAIGTPAGQLLMAHESAHVVQQHRPTGGLDAAHGGEAQADVAAVAALAGRPVPALGGAAGPQYFEAPKHQASLAHAMEEVGFGDAEQREAYFGNWCRDMSQALVPVLHGTIGVQATVTLVSSVAQMKFGRPVTPDQLGMYDPVEHMDNPAGQINTDLLQNSEGGRGPGGSLKPDAATNIPVAGRGAFHTPQRDLGSGNIAELMKVDDAGVPKYIEQSRTYAKAQIKDAIAAGRTAEGLAHIGSFSHVVEDLFAHSNWIEIAFGQLVRDGGFRTALTSDAQTEVEKRVGLGQPPIETYAADVAAAGKAARPVLMTGTFSPGARGHDTFISIKSEVQNVLSGHEPFAEEGSTEKWWDFGVELLQNVEAAADAGNLGVIFADHVRQIATNAGIGRAITGATGGLERSARKTFGEGVLGDVAAGAAGLLHSATSATVDAAGEAWESVVLKALREGADLLGARMDLVKIAYYLKHGGEEIEQAWGVVKKAVTELPASVRDRLLPGLAKAEKAFKDQLRSLLNTAYRRGVETLLDALEGPIGKTDVAESPVFRKAAALTEEIDKGDGLRAALVTAIRNAAPGPAGAAMIGRIQSASAAQLAAIANSPELRDLLASLAEADRTTVLAALDPLRDASERVAQFENLPDWAKHSGSHSQLAKDHADSPFFGAAFMMARTADHTLLSLLRQAWAESGSDERAPGFEGELEKVEEPEGEHLDPLVDTGAMDRQRDRDFLDTRAMGDRILKTGHADELPSDALLALADRLVEVAEGARADADRYPIARDLAARVDTLIATLRQNPSARLVEASCERLRHWIDKDLDATIRTGLGWLVDRVAALLDRLEHLVAQYREKGENKADHERHDSDQRSEAHFGEQIRALDRQRGTVRLESGPVRAGPTELDRKAKAAGSIEARLMAEVDRIINHPYETNWWREPLTTWANSHSREVSQWILDRNSGRVHSH